VCVTFFFGVSSVHAIEKEKNKEKQRAGKTQRKKMMGGLEKREGNCAKERARL